MRSLGYLFSLPSSLFEDVQATDKQIGDEGGQDQFRIAQDVSDRSEDRSCL